MFLCVRNARLKLQGLAKPWGVAVKWLRVNIGTQYQCVFGNALPDHIAPVFIAVRMAADVERGLRRVCAPCARNAWVTRVRRKDTEGPGMIHVPMIISSWQCPTSSVCTS